MGRLDVPFAGQELAGKAPRDFFGVDRLREYLIDNGASVVPALIGSCHAPFSRVIEVGSRSILVDMDVLSGPGCYIYSACQTSCMKIFDFGTV